MQTFGGGGGRGDLDIHRLTKIFELRDNTLPVMNITAWPVLNSVPVWWGCILTSQ